MTDAQLKAKRTLKQHQIYLTSQQIKTLNGLVKAGDVEGAMNGLQTIMGRRNRNIKG